jgi:hypothetical protein
MEEIFRGLAAVRKLLFVGTKLVVAENPSWFTITPDPGTSSVDSVSGFAGKSNTEKPPRTTIFCFRMDGL